VCVCHEVRVPCGLLHAVSVSIKCSIQGYGAVILRLCLVCLPLSPLPRGDLTAGTAGSLEKCRGGRASETRPHRCCCCCCCDGRSSSRPYSHSSAQAVQPRPRAARPGDGSSRSWRCPRPVACARWRRFHRGEILGEWHSRDLMAQAEIDLRVSAPTA
jgi:hypothetical protein